MQQDREVLPKNAEVLVLMTKEQIEKLGITFTEGMTDDDVVKALSKQKADYEAEKVKSKGLIDKYSSEIKEYKDKEAQKLTDEEKRAKEFADMQEKIATLEKEKSIGAKKAQYLKMGYSEELADKVAQGEIEGQDVSGFHAEFLKAHDEALKAELMKKNPTPKGAGEPNKTYTKEGFRKGEYSYEDLCELEAKNPALYKEITE